MAFKFLHSGSKQAWYRPRWYENHTNEGSHPSHREIPVISKYLDVLKALKILFRIYRTSILISNKLKQCTSVWIKFKFVHIKDLAQYKGEISFCKTIWSISNLLRVSISEWDWFDKKGQFSLKGRDDSYSVNFEILLLHQSNVTNRNFIVFLTIYTCFGVLTLYIYMYQHLINHLLLFYNFIWCLIHTNIGKGTCRNETRISIRYK